MASTATIDRLIINSPYEAPQQHWKYQPEIGEYELVPGRRPAGYVIASTDKPAANDPGTFVELPLVNRIRPRVGAWRVAGYPGVTSVTRRLLEHWQDPAERHDRRFFFCQLEAVETLIWLTEGPAAERVGLEVPGDGGPFERLCAKMATGSGKTIVMAMLIAWHVLNKVSYPQDRRFAKHVLVIAPGLTVRDRLAVLQPSGEGNYYDEFNVVPAGLAELLRQGRVRITNWHALAWETEQQLARRRSVDKRGPKSDEAYVRAVLDDLANARNLLVINDEAHHAWRLPAGAKLSGIAKEDVEEATRWIGGLDRIQRARGILACYDLTATPFVPSGKSSSNEALFGWIVSDFGLNDAIESGLVKTPRVVVRDESGLSADLRPKLYHLYNDPVVKDDLSRKAEPSENLPPLVAAAYQLLAQDWLATYQAWSAAGALTPPVLITVANRTETAARIKYAFTAGRFGVPALAEEGAVLHIDSRVLAQAEAADEPVSVEARPPDDEDEAETTGPKLTKQQQAELLRRQVSTVGQPGQPGAGVRNIISVGMLSEGWDAKTVTHIMGLRAFSSQLLCEQVVGRGLRRTTYDVDPATGLFTPEYVNIFGVPFSFLPHEGGDNGPRPPIKQRDLILALPERGEYAIRWPNVVRLQHSYRPVLTLDEAKLPTVRIDVRDSPTFAELGEFVDNQPQWQGGTRISLEEFARRYRLQTFVFNAAARVFDQMKPDWRGTRPALIRQLVPLVEQFLALDRVQFVPAGWNTDPLRRKVQLVLNVERIVEQIWQAIRAESVEALVPVFDEQRPVMSTADMRPWHTSKPNQPTHRSQINRCVYDSVWEASEAQTIEHSEHVAAWAKNDHLGFEIVYAHQGGRRKYRPDFLIRLTNGTTLVLEVKGQQSAETDAKRAALADWIAAVNGHGGFGRWAADISWHPWDVADILARQNGR